MHIEIKATCHLLDRICGLFALVRHFQTRKTLNGMTLPRTWLVELWQDFGKFKNQASRAYRSVVEPIERLMEDIYLQAYSDPSEYCLGILYISDVSNAM